MRSDPLVLIAEDDDSVRMTLEIVLHDEGFRVLTASDGQEALEAARASRPDVILIDGVMPKLSGDEVLRRLRAEGSLEAEVFVLSGMEAEPGQWGDAHIIGKPFDIDELVVNIRRAIAG